MKIVSGEGFKGAKILFVGEAPGSEEVKEGRPFVGRSGMLLRNLIKEAGIDELDCYITNLIKVELPDNRDPNTDEINEWGPQLIEEIAKIQPQVVVTVGAFSSKYLLEIEDKISEIRGNIFASDDYKLIPTYHPAYALRNPTAQKYILKDLELALENIK